MAYPQPFYLPTINNSSKIIITQSIQRQRGIITAVFPPFHLQHTALEILPCSSSFLPVSQGSTNLFVLRNSSGVLNAVRNNGVPAKDKGETGPIVIKAYCLDAISKAL